MGPTGSSDSRCGLPLSTTKLPFDMAPLYGNDAPNPDIRPDRGLDCASSLAGVQAWLSINHYLIAAMSGHASIATSGS